MADIDLPAFSFRPDWADGVSEKLTFLTDVMRSTTGAEQRRRVRSTPRRSVEADFLLVGPERTFWDLFMSRLAGGEVLVPFFWEAVAVSGLVAGSTTRINFDTQHREFYPGGLVMLSGGSALDFEVLAVSGVDATGITLVSAVTRSWGRGTRLMPVAPALVDEMGSPSHKSAAVAVVSARFIFNRPNKRVVPPDPATVYAGLPVFGQEPNWADDLDADFDREATRLDNSSGRIYQIDLLGRAFVGQAHRWFLPGRESLAEFRDLLYRNAGRRGTFWLPTFKADLSLKAPVASGSTRIVVAEAGLNYANVPFSGREYIAIRHSGGTIYRKIVSVLPGLTPGTERVNLDAPVGLALSPGQVRKISFMDTARFDQDEFQLTHHGPLDGLHECSAVFRTFRNARTAPMPVANPAPAGVEDWTVCGEDVPSACYEVPIFDGWYYRLDVQRVWGAMSNDWTGVNEDGSYDIGITMWFSQAVEVNGVILNANEMIWSWAGNPGNLTRGATRFARFSSPDNDGNFSIFLYFNPALTPGLMVNDFSASYGWGAHQRGYWEANDPLGQGARCRYNISGSYWNEGGLAPPLAANKVPGDYYFQNLANPPFYIS